LPDGETIAAFPPLRQAVEPTLQQQRIANGVKNGKLTPAQTANLERRESQVQAREQKDMAAHNGHLTKAEQRGINRQQNRISRSIYKDKHNK
jgi:hypothetical protein